MRGDQARALLEALGIADEEEGEPDEQRKVDFDGGARDPAPLPSDHEAEHGQLVAEVLRRQFNLGGGA